MIKPQTLKGFRDFLPQEARKRQYVINTLKSVFELYGFEPLETPTLEYEEILTGKYGDEGEQLMYRFRDRGDRNVAMRYDQTVPLARVIAQYQNQIAFPFKRYQIQPVWRAENTQKGRFREFLQCDADIVGDTTGLAEDEIIQVAITGLTKLGFQNYQIRFNHRRIFDELVKTLLAITHNQAFLNDLDSLYKLVSNLAASIDKLDKIGKEKVLAEISSKPDLRSALVSTKEQMDVLSNFLNLRSVNDKTLHILKKYLTDEQAQWFQAIETVRKNYKDKHVILSPNLSRGLNYYTGMIFEVELDGYEVGSLAGGGRYDKLIGMFNEEGKSIPAIGFAFGFDRIIEAMDELNLFPADLALSSTRVLVTIFSEELKQKSLELTAQLRLNNINAEIYLGELKENNPLEKQIKYAQQKGIPFIAVMNKDKPDEVELRYKLTNGEITKKFVQTNDLANIIKNHSRIE